MLNRRLYRPVVVINRSEAVRDILRQHGKISVCRVMDLLSAQGLRLSESVIRAQYKKVFAEAKAVVPAPVPPTPSENEDKPMTWDEAWNLASDLLSEVNEWEMLADVLNALGCDGDLVEMDGPEDDYPEGLGFRE